MQRSKPEFYAVVVWTMAASTIQVFILAALASTIIDELGINRFQIGLLGAANTAAGAVTAPYMGSATDRFGPRKAVLYVLLWSACGLLLTAVANSFLLLIAASVFLGPPQGGSNPATNKLIAEEIPVGSRGVVTGVKQSGVQLAVVFSGALMPGASSTFGWRWAVAGVGVFTLAFAAYVALRFPADESPLDPSANRSTAGTAAATSQVPLAGFVNRIAVYGFVLGFAAGGVTRFIPLFTEEELGFSETEAGAVFALSGALAIVARLGWGRLAEHRIDAGPALIIMALGSAVTCLLLFLTLTVGSWLIWPVAILTAFTLSAWNVVANLAVIKDVPTNQSGKASGVVLLGFLSGLSFGAPAIGALVDATGSYQPAWAVLGAAALAGAAVMTPDRKRNGTEG